MAFKCPFSFKTPVEEAYMVYYPKKHSKVFKSSIKHIWPPVPASSKHCIFSELVDRVDDKLCVGVHNFWKVGTQQWNSFLNYKQKTWDFTDLMFKKKKKNETKNSSNVNSGCHGTSNRLQFLVSFNMVYDKAKVQLKRFAVL